MTDYYVDSSVALQALLGHSVRAAQWFDQVSADPRHRLVSSRLLRPELTRVLRREGLPVGLRDDVLDVVALIPLTDGVLSAAEAIEPHVRTLDALHLGALVVTGLDATVATHDRMMHSAATTIGYPTIDPVED